MRQRPRPTPSCTAISTSGGPQLAAGAGPRRRPGGGSAPEHRDAPEPHLGARQVQSHASGPDRLEDAAQFGSPPNSAVLTSSEFAMRRAASSAWASLGRPHVHRHELGRSLSVAGELARERRGHLEQGACAERQRPDCADPRWAVLRRRVGEDHRAVAGRGLAVDAARFSVCVGHLTRDPSQVPRHRRVRGEEGEHRGHARLDHARALRDAGHARSASRHAERRAESFGTVSVVMIARAARARPSRQLRRRVADARLDLASGSGIPITPVEAHSTSAAGRPRRAPPRAHALGRGVPARPIATFETPLFATMARAARASFAPRDDDRRARHRRLRKTAGRAAGPIAHQQRQVETAPLDAAAHAGEAKARDDGQRGGFTGSVPPLSVRAAALLVLLAAPARARVVAADAGRGRAGGRRRGRRAPAPAPGAPAETRPRRRRASGAAARAGGLARPAAGAAAPGRAART